MLEHLTQALGREPGASAWPEISELLPVLREPARWDAVSFLLQTHVQGHGDTVYMLWNGRHFKIGRTSRALHLRKGEIDERTIVAAALSAHRDLEPKLHRVFALERRHGEWFRPTPVLHRLARTFNAMQQIAFPRAHAMYGASALWAPAPDDLLLARACLHTWRVKSRNYDDYAWYDARPKFDVRPGF